MSATGSAVGGLLQGFAQSYNAARQRRLDFDTQQRHQLASTLLTLYPQAKPEAQADIAQRVLQIYSTPLGKKMDKGLSDISTLGQSQAQQQGAASAAEVAKTMPGQTAAANAGIAAGAPQTTGQIGPQLPGAPSLPLPPSGLALQPPAQPAAPAASTYSAWYTPEERAQLQAQAAGATSEAQISGQLEAHLRNFEKFKRDNPNATPQDYMVASGRGLPYGMVRPVTLSKNVSGADASQAHPDIQTTAGEPVDPKEFYNLVQIGGQTFAEPAGLGAAQTQSGIALNQSRMSELDARKALEQARTGLVPYQTAKIIQDMQLNPQRVQIAKANSFARWFGPTTAARDSAQYAADVEDKIDALQPVMAKLASEGKLEALQGRWETFLTDKVRSGDPDVANLQNQFDILGKAVMKMHGFRNAQQAREFIAERLNAATDVNQLIGSLEGLRSSAQTYEKMAQFPPNVQQELLKAAGIDVTNGETVKPKGTERLPAPPSGGGAAKKVIVGQQVKIKGQLMTVTAVHPDGSFDAK
jgi:hypothetical protein